MLVGDGDALCRATSGDRWARDADRRPNERCFNNKREKKKKLKEQQEHNHRGNRQPLDGRTHRDSNMLHAHRHTPLDDHRCALWSALG